MKSFYRFLIFVALFSLSESSCNNSEDQSLISKAFESVSGFNASTWFQTKVFKFNSEATQISKIVLPSKNLSGTISWGYLRNMSMLQVIDLSGNSLEGHVPSWFWSTPSLSEVNLSRNRFGGSINIDYSENTSFSTIQMLNLSYNRFGNSVQLSGFPNLKILDLSHNNLVTLPTGFQNLTNLQHLDLSSCNLHSNIKPISFLHSLHYLDLSNNTLTATFPSDFPSLQFLNFSKNNFAYHNNKSKTHNHQYPTITPPIHHKKSKPKNKTVIIVVCCAVSTLVVTILCIWLVYKKKKRNKWEISLPVPQGMMMKMEKSGPFAFETESGSTWVADLKEPSSASVVMFEKLGLDIRSVSLDSGKEDHIQRKPNRI